MRISAAVATAACVLGGAASAVETTIVYLERQVERPPVLYNLELPPEDAGLMGARLGLADNATTGRFLGQTFVLDEVVVAPEMDFLPEAEALLAAGRPTRPAAPMCSTPCPTAPCWPTRWLSS